MAASSSIQIASLVLHECSALAAEVAQRADKLQPEDQGELLCMLRNVRLFLTPETPRGRTTPPVDSPSFG
jgi:hypothetical protein